MRTGQNLARIWWIVLPVTQNDTQYSSKAHPWLNAFIERAIETLQYEFINLQYHATFEDFQNFLVNAKNGYNLREHSSFNYRSPLEIWNSSGISVGFTARGL